MKYTGFLCGAFSVNGTVQADNGWRSVTVDDAMRAVSSKFYYPEFVDFCFGANINSIHRLVMDVKQKVAITVGRAATQREVDVFIPEIMFYQAPFGLALFAVRVDIDACNNDITAVISRLRSIDSVADGNASFASLVLDPLMKLYRKHARSAADVAGRENKECYARLVEYGNKLKAFQIAVVEGCEWNSETADNLLYELGTLAPIGSYNPEDDYSSSKEYFDSIMKDGKVSVFNNWKALALFDTFTMFGHDISESTIANWVENYFGMLYISELFVKFYLFRLNNDFRINHKGADKLLEQFDDFEYGCWFDNVSYNFLPRIIHHSMEQGLEVLSEKQLLYQMIAQQKNRREERDNQRMNNLLFYLTLLTTFSMVWDASSLFNEMYPYETYIGSSMVGFRVVSYALMLIVLVLIMTARFKRK